jgi:hypothetical protein
MTTDVEALANRLSEDAKYIGDEYSVEVELRMEQAADALRSQATLITRLKSMTDAQEELIREHIRAQRTAEERAEGLSAKCALLAASLGQEEKRSAELERDAGRYRWSIALEDNAEQLYAAVMSCGPKAHESIGIEIDAHIAVQAGSKEG